ncbi:MAG: hypothetical protein P8R42_27750 [Candidatus Binatia bacterium]|nr:hypothetical protein [Candidatus Binatia bacterium]
MTAVQEIHDTPFGARRGFFLGLVALATLLGIVVVVDVLPRVNPPPPKVEGEPFLPAGIGPIQAIDVVRGRKDFRLENAGGTWEMLDQGERSDIGNERVAEFMAEITDLVEIIDIGPVSELSPADFGLDHPRERVVLHPEDGREIQILLGDRNPPLTGIYIEVLPGEHVVLVGAVLLLEIDQLAALASAQAP